MGVDASAVHPGVAYFLARFALVLVQHRLANAYSDLWRNLGRSILVGLEILVGADIIRTIAISPTLTNVGVLGLIALIRTFLSFSLEAEIDGEWPWRRKELEGRGPPNGPQSPN